MTERSEAADVPAGDSAAGADGTDAIIQPDEVAYHLHLDREEAPLVAAALRLLISDEAHEPLIRSIARNVLTKCSERPAESGILVVALTAQEMKLAHTAVKLLLDDLQRGQSEERHVLARILDKLPDEHAIRAIVIE